MVEINAPDNQIDRLNEFFADMRRQELPKTREEFESRAILYHVLMALQGFLRCKAKLVVGFDEVPRNHYWGRNGK